MERVAAVGLDGPTALIREGYWITEENIGEQLPRYIKAAEKAGLEVKKASTPFSPERLLQDETPLKIMADNGIEYFRLGYVSRKATGDFRNIAEYCRTVLTEMLAVTRNYAMKPLVQLHGNGPYPHSATAAWPLVRGLPPDKIGVMLDPGNNVLQEGFEDMEYQCRLLREYIGACGVKDGIKICAAESPETGKRWESRSVPVGEGFNDWEKIISSLAQTGCAGPLVFMPFHNWDDIEKHCACLKREVAFIDQIIKRTQKA